MADSRGVPEKFRRISLVVDSNVALLKVGGSGRVMLKEVSKEATSAPLDPSNVLGESPSKPGVGS